MATIRDVAKLAGVSVATVSRVLNQNGYVNAKTESSIRSAMTALQYKPNAIARSLAGKQTSTIALMIPDIRNPFFPELAKAVESTASKHDYTVILCDSDHDSSRERKYFDVLKNKKIDGLILASYTVQPDQILELQAEGIPVVLVDNSFPAHPILSLGVRNRQGAAAAVQHLLDQGCRKIAHIAGPFQVAASHQRSLGYEEACQSKAWFVPSLIAQGDFHAEGGYSAMLELLDRHPDLDGVFAGNDLMAIGARKALSTKGRRLPEDVKLIGFDGIPVHWDELAFSTMTQPLSAMGELAVDYLIKLMNGEALPLEPHELDVELTVRPSTVRSGLETVY
ncbi:LacI family DNA-binding transcriptional regulator [Paenibacillus sp. R14(2021)]|uniref:LacI family DNA-binding transcriptional regulator n=1 Tax=Paenibacillus sp. R14(2021) TaxID=2859228 RepID=UPI001C611D49|nr:LacI family DNA-binding transcriptional regulator [Paenibacillus sp. R14(2021)]